MKEIFNGKDLNLLRRTLAFELFIVLSLLFLSCNKQTETIQRKWRLFNFGHDTITYDTFGIYFSAEEIKRAKRIPLQQLNELKHFEEIYLSSDYYIDSIVVDSLLFFYNYSHDYLSFKPIVMDYYNMLDLHHLRKGQKGGVIITKDYGILSAFYFVEFTVKTLYYRKNGIIYDSLNLNFE